MSKLNRFEYSRIETVSIPIDAASPQLCCHITKEIIKHVLYIRQLIHVPFDSFSKQFQQQQQQQQQEEEEEQQQQLENEKEGKESGPDEYPSDFETVPSKRRRKKAVRKNLVGEKQNRKFFACALSLFSSLDLAFSSFSAPSDRDYHVQQIYDRPSSVVLALVLGSSVSNAKEIYLIRFKFSTKATTDLTEETRRLFDASTRKVIRSLIGPEIFLREPRKSPTKLHVLLHLPSGFLDRLPQPQPSSSPEEMQSISASEQLDFLQKPRFCLRAKSGVPVLLLEIFGKGHCAPPHLESRHVFRKFKCLEVLEDRKKRKGMRKFKDDDEDNDDESDLRQDMEDSEKNSAEMDESEAESHCWYLSRSSIRGLKNG